jgi:hypothetical protein
MALSPRAQLRQIAKLKRSKIKRIYESGPAIDEDYTHGCRFKHGAWQVEIGCTPKRLRFTLKKVRFRLTFHYRRRTKWMLFAKAMRRVGRFTVFADTLHPGNIRPVRSWLNVEKHRESLRALHLQRQDGLFVYDNGAELVFAPRGTKQNLVLLECLIALTKFIPPPESPPSTKGMLQHVEGDWIDPKVLPPDLRSIAPLICEWAIGDDRDRWEKLESTPKKKLRELYDQVGPLIPSINAYLESFGDSPQPLEACLLFWLGHIVEIEIPTIVKLKVPTRSRSGGL